MSDYSKGKIYLIYIPGLEEYGYVGSTIVPINERLSIHKCSAKSEGKYKFASCVLFTDDNQVCIKELEAYPCENKQQLLEREKYWLSQYPEAVNKNPPILTEEERLKRSREISLRCYHNNKEHNIERNRQYKEEHKDELSQKQKQKRQSNPEAAHEKDKRNNQTRDKEKRKEWKNTKVRCVECGLVLSRNNFPTHKKNIHQGTAEYEVIATQI